MQPNQPIQPQPAPQQPFPQQPQPVFTQQPVQPQPTFAQPPMQPQAQAFQPAPTAFPQQPYTPVPVSSTIGQSYQPPRAPGPKLWIWLVAIGVPVLIGIVVLIYFLIPKGSPTAWCETQYKMSQDTLSSSSDSDKKVAANKMRDDIKKLQSAAPSEIKKDIDTFAPYVNKLADYYEKSTSSSSSSFPTMTSEESTASANITSYTSKTCTSDGKVKTSN